MQFLYISRYNTKGSESLEILIEIWCYCDVKNNEKSQYVYGRTNPKYRLIFTVNSLFFSRLCKVRFDYLLHFLVLFSMGTGGVGLLFNLLKSDGFPKTEFTFTIMFVIIRNLKALLIDVE